MVPRVELLLRLRNVEPINPVADHNHVPDGSRSVDRRASLSMMVPLAIEAVERDALYG
jgi:hypothetical protein